MADDIRITKTEDGATLMVNITAIHEFMPMLNTERLKRRTKNFRWQNTIWSGSWISRKKNKNKKKNNIAKADSRDNSLGVFHRN